MPEFCKWEITFWYSKRQENTIQSKSLPSQRMVVPPQAITALSHWCRLILLHQFSSLIINLPLTNLFHWATLLQWVSLCLNYFAECLHKSFHLMLLLTTNTSLTALSSFLFWCLQTIPSRMQQLTNQLLDSQLSCPHLFNIRRIDCRPLMKPSNSLTNTWRQNIYTDRHYNSLFFNYTMTLPDCATYSSPRLKQPPTSILPLKAPLPVISWILKLTVTLTLTLLDMLSHFPVLVNLNFVVLTLWALLDQPERKQTILQTPMSSPHSTRRKLLLLTCRTSHQEFPNSKIYLQMK